LGLLQSMSRVGAAHCSRLLLGSWTPVGGLTYFTKKRQKWLTLWRRDAANIRTKILPDTTSRSGRRWTATYIWIQDLVFPRISQQSKGEKIPALYIQKCCSVSRSPSFSKTRVCAESRCTRGKSLHRSYSPDAVHPEKVGQQPLPRVLGRSRQPFFRSRPLILPLLYIVCATLYSVHDQELGDIVQHPPAIS